MKIAQISPLWESVPPSCYGGTERVVSFLTEDLIQLGHEVSLFASADSQTKAELQAMSPMALRLDTQCIDPMGYYSVMLSKIEEQKDLFDIIHFHIDYHHFPVSKNWCERTLTTLHGRLDLPELKHVYKHFSKMPLVSISDTQRRPLESVRPNWKKTIYHGLPLELYRANYFPEPYLAFIGRVSPEKGIEDAIEIAKKANLQLKIAAKVDRIDEAYFNAKIRPLLKHPLISFIGEINEQQKQDFLGKACCLLFPIQWPEPFGLVMIEAMACGTPVLAYRGGSTPEIIRHGLNGFLAGSADESVMLLRSLESLHRRKIREYFEDHFSVRRMSLEYLQVYEALLHTRKTSETYPLEVRS